MRKVLFGLDVRAAAPAPLAQTAGASRPPRAAGVQRLPAPLRPLPRHPLARAGPHPRGRPGPATTRKAPGGCGRPIQVPSLARQVPDGFEWPFSEGDGVGQGAVTVFSASNYAGKTKNKAAPY